MFTIDVSKTLGYRDSFIFYARNKEFPKVLASDGDKDQLEAEGLIITPMKQRNINIVSARSVFKKWGHKFIKRGRPIRDDYLVGNAVEPPGLDDMRLSNDEDDSFAPVGFKRNPVKPREEMMTSGGYTVSITMDIPRTAEVLEKLIRVGFTEAQVKQMPDHELLDRLNMIALGMHQDAYVDNARLIRCATTASTYNKNTQLLRELRMELGGFLDLHTGTIHQLQLPKVDLGLQFKPAADAQILAGIFPAEYSDDWTPWQGQSSGVSKYPVALFPEQYQAVPSILVNANQKKTDPTQDLVEWEAVMNTTFRGHAVAPPKFPLPLTKPHDDADRGSIVLSQNYAGPQPPPIRIDQDPTLPRSLLNANIILPRKIHHESVLNTLQTTVEPFRPVTVDDPRFVEEMAKLNGLWFCGFIMTRTSLPCKRPVSRPHELCMYHADGVRSSPETNCC
jgi:hypothetical protein